MNKKILGIIVSVLTLAILVAPAMAAPATKIEGVTLTSGATPVRDSIRFVDHNIVHSRGTSTGPVTLTIPEYPLPEGIWDSTWAWMGKWTDFPASDPEGELIISGKVVLTFTGVGTTGTFKGTIIRKIVGLPPSGSSIVEDRMVLQGTGDFKGQTLKLSNSEGYLIIPK